MVVGSVLEYACQVWHPGLTGEQHDVLEKLQERALRIAHPNIVNIPYHEALEKCNILSLKDRTELCKRLFHDMQSESPYYMSYS